MQPAVRLGHVSPFSSTLFDSATSDQKCSRAAAAVTNAGLWPRNVPLCSPGFHTSSSGRISVTASGSP